MPHQRIVRCRGGEGRSGGIDGGAGRACLAARHHQNGLPPPSPPGGGWGDCGVLQGSRAGSPSRGVPAGLLGGVGFGPGYGRTPPDILRGYGRGASGARRKA